MPRTYTLYLNTRDAVPVPGVTSSYTFANINWDVVFSGGFARNPNNMWQVTHTMISTVFTNTAVATPKSGFVRCTGFHNMSTSVYTGATNSDAVGTYINTYQLISSYTATTSDSTLIESRPSTFMIGQPTGCGTLTLSLLGDSSTAAVPVPHAPTLHCIHTFVFTLIE